MAYHIRKAVVIGSGTMGSGIAALLAGVGVDVLLLDIAAPNTSPADPPAKRSSIANEGLKRMQGSRPAQLFAASDLDRIRTGNIDDDLAQAANADWVIEVVVERLDIKRDLMTKLAQVVGANTIVSTNTSGLPICAIAEGFDESLTRRFLGTHFFNPPRYLHLLEVIPHPNTDPAIVAYMVEFATKTLGKGVVIAKDEPNFIGNRFMSMSGTQIVNYALDNDFTVDEVDSLTGPLIGRPKTATFRLNDLVGIDIAMHVARNLYPAIPKDPARTVLEHPASTALFDRMLENKWLGNKSGQGFYKTVKTPEGGKDFYPLDLKTFDYIPPSKPRFDSVSKHRKVEDTGERIRLLINENDRAAQLLWHHHAFLLAYASQRVPEITETLVNVDNAQKWGFAHELGPFEIWDAIGVPETVPAFAAAGYPVAAWVTDMLGKSITSFYQYDDARQKVGYYSPQVGAYVPLERDSREIKVAALRASGQEVSRNGGASIFDMGDGVALLEIHSAANALDNEVLDMAQEALERLERDFDALVVGGDSERFSVGANLFLMVMAIQNGQPDQLEAMIKQGQDVYQAMRYAGKPVVTAPYNMALGGGCELIMAGVRVVAHAELYAGLVEVGVGVIPAWGGCKELVRRIVNPVMASHPNADAFPHLQKIFEQIALAKVSESAKGAREMGFLTASDRIVLNRDHLLGEARREAIHLAANYVPQHAGKVYAAGRDAYAALLVGVEGFRESGLASEHDAVIARKLAFILTGGAVSEPGWIDEQIMLDLEREAFMELVQTEKTLARIGHMLQTNKPLRN